MDSLIDVSLTTPDVSPVKPLRGEGAYESLDASTLEGKQSLESAAVVGTKDCVQSTEQQQQGLLQKHACAQAVTQCARIINQHYSRELIEAATTLQSLCNVQDTSLGLIENRHSELIDIREQFQLEEVIEEAQSYYNKLVRLKKEMAALTAKSKELTKRATYVKEVRAKEQIKKEEERKRIEQLEKELEPRYASGLT